MLIIEESGGTKYSLAHGREKLYHLINLDMETEETVYELENATWRQILTYLDVQGGDKF
jgi:hypothetical protein